MNRLRRILFGYKPIKAYPYRDNSFSKSSTTGVPSTLVSYRSRSGKIVQKIIYGYWRLKELQ